MNEKRSVWMSVLIAIAVTFALLTPLTVLAEGPPVDIEFVAQRTHLEPGQCTKLEWRVEGGFVVLLNGIPVEHVGKRKVCPIHTQPYELAVDTGEDVEFREIIIHVGQGGEPEPPPGPKPQAPAPQGPQPSVVIDFRADRTKLNAGQCTHLRWDVEHAQKVFLDGQGVVGHSSKKVCPANGRTYVLHVVHKGGPTERKVTIRVNSGGGSPPPGPGKKSVDLAVTDLYADSLPKGRVWVRVTNHGPATLKNAKIQMKCNAHGQPLGGQKPWQHVEAPWLHTVSLQPGQTATFKTKMTVNTNKYAYNVTCGVSPPSQGKTFTDPNWSNNNYSEPIVSQGSKPSPSPAPRRADLAVTDLYANKLRNGKLFARITNHGPATLKSAKAQLECQGAGWKGGAPTALQRQRTVTLNLSPGQTTAFDTGMVINIDQFDYYEMTCTVNAQVDDPNPSNNPHSELIP
jgi:hypothetical protein